MDDSQSLLYRLKDYRKEWLKGDLFAAITVTVMLIPQGMAYALLAGLPPIYGLYAALVPMLVYPLLGSSNYLSVGPVALVSIIVLTGLSKFAEPMSKEFIELAILTSLVAGVIQLLLSLFRMGFLVNFLSHPVISGFTSAAAFIIALSQVKHLLGIEIASSQNVFSTVQSIVYNIADVNFNALMIGMIGLAVILTLKKLKPAFPSALLAIVVGILYVRFTGLGTGGVEVVGQVPAGLPAFGFPEVTVGTISQILPLALVICLISFIESLAIAKTLAGKHEEYNVDANKELLGLGMAKVVGSFFQAFPNTGSFSRSAINEQAGARTGVSSMIAALLVGLVLLFFTTFFYYLPNAVLAAVVIAAVVGLVDVQEAKRLFRSHKRDFVVLVITFLLTLFLGIQRGVLVGVGLSLLFILQKVSRPHFAVLGKLRGTDLYRNVARFSDAEVNPSRLIFRYDDDIFFGNAQHFLDAVLKNLQEQPEVRQLILDLSSVNNIDSTGMHQLELLQKTTDAHGIELHLCSVKGPLRDIFHKVGLDNMIAKERIHWNVKEAINDIEGNSVSVIHETSKS